MPAAGSPARPPGDRRHAPARRIATGLIVYGTWRIARAGPAATALAARAPEHARYWEEFSRRGGTFPWIALGDSTALGLGAEPGASYVGQLERRLGANLDVHNLGLPGARLADIAATALPRLAELDLDRALVTFAGGLADLADFDPHRFRAHLVRVLDGLPDHALVADLPRLHLPPQVDHVRPANAILHAEADARGLAVVPVHAHTRRPGPFGWVLCSAPDLVHPNRWGYRLWADAFEPAARARLEELGTRISSG